jgi:hypothetical protein
MSLYCCEDNPLHDRTDQNIFVGCWQCYIENMAMVGDAFFGRHIYAPGMRTGPGHTYWDGDLIAEINDYGLFATSIFWEGQLLWNTNHRKANWYVEEYKYGVSGSGTILPGGGLDYPTSGVLVADFFGSPHGYPVDSGIATNDLVPYPYTCIKCGAYTPIGEQLCLACDQKARGHTCSRCLQ